VEGVPHRLVDAPGRGVRRGDGALHLRMDDGQAGPRLRAWLKTAARRRLSAACDHYAARLGRPYTRLTLRDTRSRWGSCSAQGGLNFSWRLFMAPPDVLDYVAAHEVAHLAQMNHSPAFWAEVSRLFGPHETQRRWLRAEGAALHAVDFDPPEPAPGARRPVAP
jgi:predicted metal-dependent hydrolase